MLYEPQQITDALRGRPLWAFNYHYHATPMLGQIRGDHFYYDGCHGSYAPTGNRFYADTEKEAVAAYNRQVQEHITKLKSDLAWAEKALLPEV